MICLLSNQKTICKKPPNHHILGLILKIVDNLLQIPLHLSRLHGENEPPMPER